MTRALGVCVAMAALLAGCVSIGGPSAQPSIGRSFGITTPAPGASATTAATTAATQPATTTPTPTDEPTATPSAAATPTPTASAEATETPGAATNDLVFSDDMSDPSSGWGVTDTDLSTIAYEGGALRITIHQEAGASFSQHTVGGEYAVVLAAAEFQPTAGGAFGLLCTSSDGLRYGAALTTNGALVFFAIQEGDVIPLKRINDVGSDLPVGESTVFGLECAGTATGALHLVAVLPGEGPLGAYQSDTGSNTFSGIAVYGEGFEQEFSVDVELVAAYGIAGSADGMTPEGEELLTHVPADWQQTCTESPIPENGVAILHCYLQSEGVGAELAQFQSFSNNSDMDAAYQEAVENYGVEPTESCETGPNETTWSIENESFGRVQCAPQQVGIRFDWTDDRLSILSTLIDFDGDYENTYGAWLEAGPNP